MAARTTGATLPADKIEVPATRMRAIDPATIGSLVASIEAIGVLYPVHVRVVRDGARGEPTYTLLAGAHRVAACARLGMPVPAIVREGGSELDDRLLEISENLHRCPLSALERDRHIAAWIELQEAKQKQKAISGQSDQKIGRGRPEGGISAAARELGVDRKDAERAQRVAKLEPEAQQAARDVGLDDNRTALLVASRAADGEAQVASLRRQAEQHREREEARQRQREAAQPAPAASPDAEPAPIAEATELVGEPNVDQYVREAAMFAGLIGQYVEQEHIAKLVHWLRTVPSGFLVTALREVA